MSRQCLSRWVWLVRLGLNRRRWLDVDSEPLRTRGRSPPATAVTWSTLTSRRSAGSPAAAAGGSTAGPACCTAPPAGPRPPAPAPGTCTCTPLSTDTGRLPYAEHLPDETAATAVGFGARAGLVHRPRHHHHHPGRHRQRFRLPVHRVRPRRLPHQPAPADPAVHPQAQRESRALSADARRGALDHIESPTCSARQRVGAPDRDNSEGRSRPNGYVLSGNLRRARSTGYLNTRGMPDVAAPIRDGSG